MCGHVRSSIYLSQRGDPPDRCASEIFQANIENRMNSIALRYRNGRFGERHRAARAFFTSAQEYPSRDKNRRRACRLGGEDRIKCKTAVSVFRDEVRREEKRAVLEESLFLSLSVYALSWLALVTLESSRRLIEALEDPAVSFYTRGSAFDYIRVFMNMHDGKRERWREVGARAKIYGRDSLTFRGPATCVRASEHAPERSLTIAVYNRN